MTNTKGELLTCWLDETLLADIRSPDTPDPVPFLTRTDGELTTTDELDSYRYGNNDGDYLYLIYLAPDQIRDATDITPIYVGESSNIGSRIYQHYKKIDQSAPTDGWKDDGSWGSFSKYDHLAAVREWADSQLYVWILDVDTLDASPYGVETYRQELEAKLVGFVFSHPAYQQTMTNREFVPNQALHEIGKAGGEWLDCDPVIQGAADSHPTDAVTGFETKADYWAWWLDTHVYPDIVDDSTADPIPLFATDAGLQVELTDTGRLKRSTAIDERIRSEGKKCVHPTGVRDDGYEGLLYMLYQLGEPDERGRPTIVPRYIGKGEAYGKKNELSANFEEIAKGRSATRSFARWGDGNYWHVGELSMALFEGDTRKLAWAAELFEQGTRRLKQQTYLWVQAWNQNEHTGPYGYPAYLAEVEPQLIGLANAVSSESLLNKEGVPDDARINTTEFTFESAIDENPVLRARL